MALSFDAFDTKEIRCGHLHSHYDITDGRLVRRETHFVGVQGNSEVVSKPGGWDIVYDVWLNDDLFLPEATGSSLLNGYRRDLRNWIGRHGELKETWEDYPAFENVFKNCTFLGFTAVPFESQKKAQPVYDVIGKIGGWVLQGELRWRCLREPD